MPTIRLSVRELVEFLLRTGSSRNVSTLTAHKKWTALVFESRPFFLIPR